MRIRNLIIMTRKKHDHFAAQMLIQLQWNQSENLGDTITVDRYAKKLYFFFVKSITYDSLFVNLISLRFLVYTCIQLILH